MVFDREVVARDDPAGSVAFGAGRFGQRLGERRCLDASGPQHSARVVACLVSVVVKKRPRSETSNVSAMVI